MGLIGEWTRRQVACYGAVIAIILEQLDAYPRSTITKDPNPLVRIREQAHAPGGWHPDELITQPSGQQFVLVWEHVALTEVTSRQHFLSN